MVSALLFALLSLAPHSGVGDSIALQDHIGVWENPQGTVRVRVMMCGTRLCGTVVSASASAISDAREAGVPELVGLGLLRDYRRIGPDRWAGWVFVPDLGRSFSSRIIQVNRDRLRITGCLVGALFCKSQIWKRF